MNLIDKCGGRKFVLSVSILLASLVLVLAGKLDVDFFITQSVAISGIYGVTNVWEKK